MNIALPQSAFFLPPTSSENNGVDFLGLRQANLDMMAALVPGTNNVTSYIRPFSVLSWIFWKFHGLCEQAETTGRPARMCACSESASRSFSPGALALMTHQIFPASGLSHLRERDLSR